MINKASRSPHETSNPDVASRSPHETSNPDVGCVRYARTRFLFKQPQSQRRVGMCCPRTPFRLPEKVQAAFSRAGRVARIRRRRLPRRQTDGAAGRTACPPPKKRRGPTFRRPREPNPLRLGRQPLLAGNPLGRQVYLYLHRLGFLRTFSTSPRLDQRRRRKPPTNPLFPLRPNRHTARDDR